MFSLFGKTKKYEVDREDFNIYAPCDGKCIDIVDVDDDAFSKRMLGDGFAIEPTNGTICSPCNGEITMIFPSGHAFGIKMFNETEVIVHIGIDSVDANGKGFTKLKKVGDVVADGEPVIKADLSTFKNLGIDMTTMTVFTAVKEGLIKKHLNEAVSTNALIIDKNDLLEALHEADKEDQQ